MVIGGGLLAYREHLRGKPAPVWVPLPLRADISMEEQTRIAKEIEKNLREEGILRAVVVDAGLQKKFGAVSEAAAMQELSKRLYAKASTMKTADGTVPSINVGVNGTGRERQLLGDAVMRMNQDVLRMVGIDPKTGKPIDLPAAATPVDPGGSPIPKF